jgi:hypothetical protein
MKKMLMLACFILLACALGAQASGRKILYVYDEVNNNSKPYIDYFREALTAQGIAYDEATASQVASKDLSGYQTILVHGMVMAFASKSPVRDWLKADRRLEGKNVELFVTANRWFVDKLFKQLSDLLAKDKADSVDAVSMATKSMDAAAKKAAVRSFVARLK